MNAFLLILTTLPATDPCPTNGCPTNSGLPPITPVLLPDPTARATPAHTPNWDATVRNAGWCPPLIVQAFQRLPRVCPVIPCPCDPVEGSAYHPQVWVKEFHHAAHVPLPRFTLEGNPVQAEGLLIYEGMRLTVDPHTGNYDVSFTATVPNMPVTLRMQLILTNPVNPQDQYRLTLPPIRMQPPKDARPGDPTPNTFHVAHRGYSSLFLDERHWPHAQRAPVPADCRPQPAINCHWMLTRVGTARFGTPVAIDDPNR
jgi:hypothetical protein